MLINIFLKSTLLETNKDNSSVIENCITMVCENWNNTSIYQSLVDVVTNVVPRER